MSILHATVNDNISAGKKYLCQLWNNARKQSQRATKAQEDTRTQLGYKLSKDFFSSVLLVVVR